MYQHTRDELISHYKAAINMRRQWIQENRRDPRQNQWYREIAELNHKLRFLDEEHPDAIPETYGDW